MSRPFLTAEWRELAVLNFEIDPALLKPWMPQSTELDLWNGTALVSLVGFQFLDTRVLEAAIPFHRNFDEVNLRFYVQGSEGRGVVFIREFVPRPAISLIANSLYGEHYATARMQHSIERKDVFGNYEQSNCVWLPKSEQWENQRFRIDRQIRLANNTSGHTNLYWRKTSRRWIIQKTIDGKTKFLVNFKP